MHNKAFFLELILTKKIIENSTIRNEIFIIKIKGGENDGTKRKFETN